MEEYSKNIENQKEKKSLSTGPGPKQQPLLSPWCISSQLQNTSNEMVSFKNKNCFLKLFDRSETWIQLLVSKSNWYSFILFFKIREE